MSQNTCPKSYLINKNTSLIKRNVLLSCFGFSAGQFVTLRIIFIMTFSLEAIIGIKSIRVGVGER